MNQSTAGAVILVPLVVGLVLSGCSAPPATPGLPTTPESLARSGLSVTTGISAEDVADLDQFLGTIAGSGESIPEQFLILADDCKTDDRGACLKLAPLAEDFAGSVTDPVVQDAAQSLSDLAARLGEPGTPTVDMPTPTLTPTPTPEDTPTPVPEDTPTPVPDDPTTPTDDRPSSAAPVT